MKFIYSLRCLAFSVLVLSSVVPSSYAEKTDDRPKADRGAMSLTLVRSRDYHYASANVDCPNCKDMYCATVEPPSRGEHIVSIEWIRRRPVNNNHWYRCQVEAKCGRPEFSDPQDAREDCTGKSQCNICRATNDGVPNYEDDFEMKYK